MRANIARKETAEGWFSLSLSVCACVRVLACSSEFATPEVGRLILRLDF